MSVKKSKLKAIAESELLQDYYSSLHDAYRAMLDAFDLRSKEKNLTQDDLATLLGINKALVSRRLNGRENLTLRTLSNMATALDCRLAVDFKTYESHSPSNYPVSDGLSITSGMSPVASAFSPNSSRWQAA